MKLESFEVPPQEPSRNEAEAENESRAAKYLKKLRKIAGIGYMTAAVSLGGYGVKEFFENRQEYAKYADNYSPEQKARYGSLKKKLLTEVGEKGVRAIESGDRASFWNRREKPEPTKISGFESVGIDDKVFERTWSDENGAYPRGWITGEVGNVRYIDSERTMPSQYGEELKGEKASGESDGYSIEFYKLDESIVKDGKETTFDVLDYTFGHELGHHNDWETDRQSALVERAELLSMVIELMRKDHPYKSLVRDFSGAPAYHEEIQGMEEHEKTRLQAKEYWAELCGDYFAAPEILREVSPDDYAIVDSYVKKIDPSFDPIKAETLRNAAIAGK